ncbi:beta-1,4-galactosyltransferase galt-1-like [Octopus sinensis]|uniref:Glycosyltransferase family 92 protein n=1 Tax=Octopus sinensis TaxID=2607531 RepID=A0A6P7SI15_9MOLL|nr:beta-1,4-galactosyltransferase galt-1-like [Octopus sinensis]
MAVCILLALFAACYFLCPLHQFKANDPPVSVSIVLKKKCQQPRNHILVTPNSVVRKTGKKNFTVCLSPLHSNYDRMDELVEWMEVNKLFGADYFIFYNYSISRNVTAIIKKYAEEGLSETVEWKIPFKSEGGSEIHYFGQLAAINDCLYRNMYRTKFIVFIDADEFIIPRKHRNWMTFIDSLKHATNIGAYIFRCTFFRKEWEDAKENFTGKDLAEKYNIVSLLKLDREPKIHPAYIRSKTIVNPLKVETVGIHNIWTFRTGYVASEVGISQGLVHHYRNWENHKDKQKVHDYSILAYKDSIIKRITERWKILEEVLQEVKQ